MKTKFALYVLSIFCALFDFLTTANFTGNPFSSVNLNDFSGVSFFLVKYGNHLSLGAASLLLYLVAPDITEDEDYSIKNLVAVILAILVLPILGTILFENQIVDVKIFLHLHWVLYVILLIRLFILNMLIKILSPYTNDTHDSAGTYGVKEN